ncbi:hypothetical protein [Gordonia malaquae]|uniref:hypothetical protein n=1 Tax=Gordonia malaquae TaxID=410332 RepID=UPI003018802F
MDDSEQVVRTGAPVSLSWNPEEGCVRAMERPRRVLVDGRALGGASVLLFADPKPTMGVRAGGLRVLGENPGWQLAWVRVSSGQWVALVTVSISSANEATSVRDLTLLVGPDDVRLID